MWLEQWKLREARYAPLRTNAQWRRLTYLSRKPTWTGVISHCNDWSCGFAAYPLLEPDSTYSLPPSLCEKSYSSERRYRILCSMAGNWPKRLAVDRVQPISALSQIQAARWVYLQVKETASPLPLQVFCNGLEREHSVPPQPRSSITDVLPYRNHCRSLFFPGGCSEPSPWGSVVSRTF